MITIFRATEKDFQTIVDIGKISVSEAHEGSSAPEDLMKYIGNNYNEEAIKKELNNNKNIYHIITYNGKAIGFSKINLNAKHPEIADENVVKLDRIYLLKEFQGHKLGFELLNHNIEFAKKHDQNGIWLFTWVGNLKAISFYKKVGFKTIASHQFFVTKTTSNLNHQMLLNF
ncbi:GNAT family N-acetyltransferase [Halpernia frigidisoli]|uniref:Ribosomal protein S18 acetylase RimI n=1 Tax=Halpernia frigidisoli TaxID=1125876 RepID=A0A1I3CQ05_9FLAO|nr:GNAT family N-acetyltransferase [Halpernia frigidisoli]SFH76615.1 Ribosomal protein S18 acetylase RimI [Halpernia frigidisoli]